MFIRVCGGVDRIPIFEVELLIEILFRKKLGSVSNINKAKRLIENLVLAFLRFSNPSWHKEKNKKEHKGPLFGEKVAKRFSRSAGNLEE